MVFEEADSAMRLQELQTKEIKNARLAMVAFVGMAYAHMWPCSHRGEGLPQHCNHIIARRAPLGLHALCCLSMQLEV